MIIMSVDPSTTVTGWAVIEVQDGAVVDFESGFIDAHRKAKDGMGYRLDYILRSLRHEAAKHNIDSVAMEGGFVGGNSSTSLVIGYARAIVWMLAAGLDVGATMYAPASIKKQIAGTGRASKNDVNNAVRGLLRIEQRLEENEADALAVGLTHLTVTGLWNRMFDEVD